MAKLLPPTLREKNRYMAFAVYSEEKFSRNEIVKAIWNQVLKYLGESGAAKTSLWIMDWDEEKQRGIIKVNHLSVSGVRASLVLIKEAGTKDDRKRCIFHVLGVSGTLKKVRGEFF